MSKMFDALRRAEAERRRKAESDSSAAAENTAPARAAQPVSSTKPMTHVARPDVTPIEVASGMDALPEGFVRELGILRNSIDTTLGDLRKRAIMFTSSAHEEGTTTLALNYAKLVATHGHGRVLLIEINARRPSLFWRLGLSNNEGVTDYFESNRPLASVVQRVDALGVDVVHIGQRDPAKIQQYLERSFPEMIQEGLRNYDTVIVDAPPRCPFAGNTADDGGHGRHRAGGAVRTNKA